LTGQISGTLWTWKPSMEGMLTEQFQFLFESFSLLFKQFTRWCG
jgi:hypothetical protein